MSRTKYSGPWGATVPAVTALIAIVVLVLGVVLAAALPATGLNVSGYAVDDAICTTQTDGRVHSTDYLFTP